MSQFTQAAEEHPFAPYVRILGKGKSGSRSLQRSEAADAFGMILRGEVEAVQLGAFLMLLRVKEETGDELAGFVDACRQQMVQPPAELHADLDWSSYAGKKHQHPWYLLSLLLISGAGYRVLVHGSDGHTAGRLYTEQAMRELGLPVASDWRQVAAQMEQQQLSYLPLRAFCPALHELILLRPLLGLRSPVNTLTRLLNPLAAPASLQSVFHPAYSTLHQRADTLLGQANAGVFKGESGEVEVRPHADTQFYRLHDGHIDEHTLPRVMTVKAVPVEQPAVAPLLALWRGSATDAYGLNAVLATTTAALMVLEPDWGMPACVAAAQDMWASRDRERLD